VRPGWPPRPCGRHCGSAPGQRKRRLERQIGQLTDKNLRLRTNLPVDPGKLSGVIGFNERAQRGINPCSARYSGAAWMVSRIKSAISWCAAVSASIACPTAGSCCAHADRGSPYEAGAAPGHGRTRRPCPSMTRTCATRWRKSAISRRAASTAASVSSSRSLPARATCISSLHTTPHPAFHPAAGRAQPRSLHNGTANAAPSAQAGSSGMYAAWGAISGIGDRGRDCPSG